MTEGLVITRPPSRLLSHTALGLLKPGSSLSRPGTSALGAEKHRFAKSCPVLITPASQPVTKDKSLSWSQRMSPLKVPDRSRRASDESKFSPRTPRRGKERQERKHSSQWRHRSDFNFSASQSMNSFFSPPSEGLQSDFHDILGSTCGDTVELLAEEFNRGVKRVEHRIDDILSRNLRMDQPMSKEEEAEREQRETDRRRREEEKRKARKREQAARNPHKKVALRLENTRRFDPDAEQNNNIPVQKIDVSGIKGTELIEVVDVTMLKSKCLALQHGANVKTLMEVVKTRELKAKLASGGMVSPRTPDPQAQSSHSPMRESYEARREKVVLQREVQHIDKIANRLNTMRRTFTKALPYDVESAATRRIMGLGEISLSDRQGAMQQVTAQMRPRISKSKTLSTTTFARQKTRGKNHLDMLRATARRAWAIVRALVSWLAVGFQVRRRNRAMDIMKTTISQCGEWSRIRVAMHRLTRTVIHLQHRAKEFLRLKHQRLDFMQQQWQRVEDNLVETYCINSATEALRDKYEEGSRNYLVSQAKEAKLKSNKDLHKKLKEDVVRLNWKQFRIPPAKRRATLSRYYMVTLRKHMRNQTCIVTMVRRIVQSQREMVGYLKEFGAELKNDYTVTSDDKVVHEVEAKRWWHLTEETIAQLMALCAKDLSDSGVEPFQAHPSLADVPGNPMYQSGLQDIEAALVLAPVGSGRGASRPARKAPSTQSIKKCAKKATVWPRKRGQRADIEDVFGLFTPRLREITEKQSMEYRTSNPARAATPLAAVA